MSDAIQTLITALQNNKTAPDGRPEPVRIPIEQFVAALQEIESGLSPVINNQNANTVYAGPASGAPATPAFRGVVSADLTTALTTPPAIGGTTPAAGSFTTLSASSLIEPTSTQGIKGTTTNDNAPAGSDGEYSSVVVAQGAALPSNSSAATTICTLALSAGDFDVSGVVGSTVGGGPITTQVGWLNTSASQPAVPGDGGIASSDGVASTSGFTMGIPTKRFSSAAPFTVYLVGVIVYTGGSGNSVFGAIRARRVR